MMMLLFGFLGLLLFGGILIALTGGTDLVTRLQGDRSTVSAHRREETAREMLDMRLARGEISEQEYETIRKRIQS